MLKRLLAAVLALGLIGLLALWAELYRPYQGYSGSVVVVVESRMRGAAVADLLLARGVLPHRLPFLLRYWFSRPWRSLKAGEYLFSRPMRPIDVYRKLVQGDVLLHSVVIPEGSDRFDMARIFHQRLGLGPQQFMRVTEDNSAIRDLDPQASTLEGYLFPDTYRFPRGASAAAVVTAMLARFRQVLESNFPPELRETPQKLHDVVTLASLVEKETPAAEERATIAGVFLKRLERRWPLQCDPTVIYAARLDGRPIGAILQSDLEFDSPYNTYRHAGLPPGPIASPGEVSLRAALEPADTGFLYFVSDSQGGHVFARTLAEHQRNVARYRGRVAALRRVAREKNNSSVQAPPPRHGGETDSTRSSAKGGQKKQQKRADPGML